MTSTPAGWYGDGHGATRWWDGAQWTEHTQPAAHDEPAAVDQPAAVATAPAPFSGTAAALPPVAPAKRGWLIPVILGGSFLLLVLLAVIFIPMLVKTLATGGYTVTSESGVITVRTDERYTSYLDEDDEPVPGYDALSTVDDTLVVSGGEWLVDSASYIEE